MAAGVRGGGRLAGRADGDPRGDARDRPARCAEKARARFAIDAAMRALRFDRYGSSDLLRVEEVSEPVPRAGQAKVRVRAAGLNPIDWKIRAGDLRLVPLFKGPPRGLGCDFAGEVVAGGGGATERHVGERVFGSLAPFAREGALAEFLVVAYDRILPIPDGVDEAVAAALPVAGGTALQ